MIRPADHCHQWGMSPGSHSGGYYSATMWYLVDHVLPVVENSATHLETRHPGVPYLRFKWVAVVWFKNRTPGQLTATRGQSDIPYCLVPLLVHRELLHPSTWSSQGWGLLNHMQFLLSVIDFSHFSVSKIIKTFYALNITSISDRSDLWQLLWNIECNSLDITSIFAKWNLSVTENLLWLR